jgi:alpha-galactosidase
MNHKNHNRKKLNLILVIALTFMGIGQLSAQTVWLDQLDLSAATQGYGTPKKNKSVDGKTITIGGRTF